MGLLDAPPVRSYRSGILSGLAPVTTRPNCQTLNTGNLSDGTNTSANYRYMHQFTTAASDLRLLYVNHYAGATPGPNSITVKVQIEYPSISAPSNTQSGTSIPVTFNGSTSATIDAGGYVLSDPIPMIATAGRYIYTRTYVSVASAGEKWPLDLFTESSPNFEGATKGAPASDLSAAGGTTIANTIEAGYGPALIVGVPLSGHPASVALLGDSIIYGSGEFFSNGYGFAARALTTASIPYVQLGLPGEKAQDLNASNGEKAYRFRMNLGAACTHAIEEYGRNDWAASRTLAQIQADKLVIATWYSTRGVRVYATTNIPGTTSTDGWITTGNQAVTAAEAVRVALNAWIRAGMPLDPVTKAAVAIGTSGALLAGVSGHPYAGYFEIADTVETARDSGIWRPPALVIADAAISSSSQTFTSASSSFLTTATKGQRVAVVGAGSAGGVLNTTIGATVSSNTTLTLTNAASTTVTGATAGIGTMTSDGTHPSQNGHILMAAGVTTTVLV